MSKFTKGPWAYHSWGAKASGRRFGIETADNRHGLAVIAPNESASSGLSMAEHEANAKLMSQSPLLFEAVQLWLRFFDEMPKGQFGKIACDIGLMNQAFLKSREAVAKVTDE